MKRIDSSIKDDVGSFFSNEHDYAKNGIWVGELKVLSQTTEKNKKMYYPAEVS